MRLRDAARRPGQAGPLQRDRSLCRLTRPHQIAPPRLHAGEVTQAHRQPNAVVWVLLRQRLAKRYCRDRLRALLALPSLVAVDPGEPLVQFQVAHEKQARLGELSQHVVVLGEVAKVDGLEPVVRQGTQRQQRLI